MMSHVKVLIARAVFDYLVCVILDFWYFAMYRIAQNFGSKKHWRMKLYLPMFFLPII